ncbi:MAG: hypothetical protein V4508_09180 [Pseudomonadota bacterium]
MKVRKNLEAVFLAAAVMATFAAYATAEVPSFHAAHNAKLSTAIDNAKLQVVVVAHKRLTAAEKAALN